MNIPDSPNKKRCLTPSPHNSPGGDGKQSPLKKGKHDGLTAGGGHAQGGGDGENSTDLMSRLGQVSQEEGNGSIGGGQETAMDMDKDNINGLLFSGNNLANKPMNDGQGSGKANQESPNKDASQSGRLFTPRSTRGYPHNGLGSTRRSSTGGAESPPTSKPDSYVPADPRKRPNPNRVGASVAVGTSSPASRSPYHNSKVDEIVQRVGYQINSPKATSNVAKSDNLGSSPASRSTVQQSPSLVRASRPSPSGPSAPLTSDDSASTFSFTGDIRRGMGATNLGDSGVLDLLQFLWSNWPRVAHKNRLVFYSPLVDILGKPEGSSEMKLQYPCYLFSSSIDWIHWEDAEIQCGDALPVFAKVTPKGCQADGQRPNECLVENLPVIWDGLVNRAVVKINVNLYNAGQSPIIRLGHTITIAVDAKSAGDRIIGPGQMIMLEAVDASGVKKFVRLDGKCGKLTMAAMPSIMELEMVPSKSTKVKLIFPHENRISKTLLIESVDSLGNTVRPPPAKLRDGDLVSISLDPESQEVQMLRDQVRLAQSTPGGDVVLRKGDTGGVAHCFRIIRCRRSVLFGSPTEVMDNQRRLNEDANPTT